MKSFVIALAVALVAATSVPGDAYARRVGGGGTSGMQRSVPPRATPDAPKPAAPAAQPAGPTAAAAAAPAAAAKRSWLGPIAGLAAGLGIAALMSHLGLGEAFGNILMLILLAAVAFFAIRFLMRRFGPKPAAAGHGNLQFAGAGAPMQQPRPRSSRRPRGRRRQAAAAAPRRAPAPRCRPASTPTASSASPR